MTAPRDRGESVVRAEGRVARKAASAAPQARRPYNGDCEVTDTESSRRRVHCPDRVRGSPAPRRCIAGVAGLDAGVHAPAPVPETRRPARHAPVPRALDCAARGPRLSRPSPTLSRIVPNVSIVVRTARLTPCRRVSCLSEKETAYDFPVRGAGAWRAERSPDASRGDSSVDGPDQSAEAGACAAGRRGEWRRSTDVPG